MYSQLIDEFVRNESLTPAYVEDANRWFVPLSDLCRELLDIIPKPPLIIGINGCQGSGKSTLSALLKTLLGPAGKTVVVLSIDDFYLTGAERQRLAREVHPLLATRGVPGTHDPGLALNCINRLQRLRHGETLTLPVFDKAGDEPRPRGQWPVVEGPVDVIILEGWFVGCRAMTDAELQEPVNQLESSEDPRGKWRRWVNEQLAGQYQSLFDLIDLLVMLRAPAFDAVFGWRRQQEEKLRRLVENSGEPSTLMDDKALSRFIQHYERLTRHCLQTLPDEADIVFELDKQQRVVARKDREASVTE